MAGGPNPPAPFPSILRRLDREGVPRLQGQGCSCSLKLQQLVGCVDDASWPDNGAQGQIELSAQAALSLLVPGEVGETAEGAINSLGVGNGEFATVGLEGRVDTVGIGVDGETLALGGGFDVGLGQALELFEGLLSGDLAIFVRLADGLGALADGEQEGLG
jgi:hypothetical protein